MASVLKMSERGVLLPNYEEVLSLKDWTNLAKNPYAYPDCKEKNTESCKKERLEPRALVGKEAMKMDALCTVRY